MNSTQVGAARAASRTKWARLRSRRALRPGSRRRLRGPGTRCLLGDRNPGGTRGNARRPPHLNQVLHKSPASPRAPPSPCPSPAPRAPNHIHRPPLAKGSGSRLACSNRAQWELGDWPSGPEAGLEAVATGSSARAVPASKLCVGPGAPLEP